jgi:hypothetical protein
VGVGEGFGSVDEEGVPAVGRELDPEQRRRKTISLDSAM